MTNDHSVRSLGAVLSVLLVVVTLCSGCAAPEPPAPAPAAAAPAATADAGPPAQQVEALSQSAQSHADAGQQKEAAADYQRAADLSHQIGDRESEAAALSGAGLADESLKQDDQAMQAYDNAITIFEAIRSETPSNEANASEPEHSALDWVYQRDARLRMKAGQAAQSFDLSERARARTFLTQLSAQHMDVRAQGDPSLVAQEQELRGELADLEQSARQQMRQARTVRSEEEFDRLKDGYDAIMATTEARRTEYSDVLARLKRSDPEYASLVNLDPPTLADIQGMLDARTTLLSFFVGPDFSLAYVITQDKLVAKELPIGKAEIEKIVLAHEYAQPDGSLAGFSRLYQGLIAPVRAELRTPILGIIPYGALHYVPFAAMGDGGGWLGDSFSIFELPSASTLPFVQAKSNQASSEGKIRPDEVLAMAPNFPGGPFTPLLFSALETEYVSELYGATPYFADEASEATFKKRAPDARLIHLSTHGEFNSTNPLFSRIERAAARTAPSKLTRSTGWTYTTPSSSSSAPARPRSTSRARATTWWA